MKMVKMRNKTSIKNLIFHTQFPMRKTYYFHGIVISSDFDGRNMRRWIANEGDAVLNSQNENESAKPNIK